MSVLVRSLRNLGPSQLAILALALAACATAQEPDDDDDGNGQPQAGGSSGMSGAGAFTSGTSPVGTGGMPPTGTAGTNATAGTGQAGSSSTSGSGGGGASSTGGTTGAAGSTGTAGTTGGTSSSTCPQYAGARTEMSAIFMGGFGKATTGTWSGYGFTYTYGTGAAILPGMGNGCFAAAKFCANGTVPASSMAGAGLGWNIAQVNGSMTKSTVAVTTPVTMKFAGAVAGMRVQLSASPTVSYCYTLTAAEATAGTVTIPLASFKTECWGATGMAYDGVAPIESIHMVVPGNDAAAQTFDFCMLDVEPG